MKGYFFKRWRVLNAASVLVEDELQHLAFDFDFSLLSGLVDV